MVSEVTGNRVASLLAYELPPIEVVNQHITRRRIVADCWPKTAVELFPTERLIAVKTPAGIVQRVRVRLRVVGEYVHAVADPGGRMRGEDPEASCAFPLESELEAERRALELV